MARALPLTKHIKHTFLLNQTRHNWSCFSTPLARAIVNGAKVPTCNRSQTIYSTVCRAHGNDAYTFLPRTSRPGRVFPDAPMSRDRLTLRRPGKGQPFSDTTQLEAPSGTSTCRWLIFSVYAFWLEILSISWPATT